MVQWQKLDTFVLKILENSEVFQSRKAWRCLFLFHIPAKKVCWLLGRGLHGRQKDQCTMMHAAKIWGFFFWSLCSKIIIVGNPFTILLWILCWLDLPYLANKDRGQPAKFEFQIIREITFSLSISHAIFGNPNFGLSVICHFSKAWI